MGRKAIFFTSDWHGNHENILKFSKRPFTDIKHMHRVLINNYNAVVPENGICYFLGDMGGKDKGGKNFDMKSFMSKLNGTKVLIQGNHGDKTNHSYNIGFDVVLQSASMVIAKELVTMSHYPLIGVYREDITGMKRAVDGDNWYGESRFKHLAIENNGQFHLNGHIHSPNGGKSEKICGRQYDVGVDANKFTPIHIKQIESWIVRTLNNEK